MHAQIHSRVVLGSLGAFAMDGALRNAMVSLTGESLRAGWGVSQSGAQDGQQERQQPQEFHLEVGNRDCDWLEHWEIKSWLTIGRVCLAERFREKIGGLMSCVFWQLVSFIFSLSVEIWKQLRVWTRPCLFERSHTWTQTAYQFGKAPNEVCSMMYSNS